MNDKNMQILMRRHPSGSVREDDFSIVQGDRPEPAAGEVLVRNLYLSLDPYMRLRMDPARSYQPPLQPGEVMPGGTVGQVVESRVPDLAPGTIVTGRLGWQVYATAAPAQLRVVPPGDAPISTALGVLGMPGVTAHYGLLSIGRPKAGDTVVVSAASGAVGSVVGQIARLKGCRAIGIAGGRRKCRYVVEELGFDACIDYRADDFESRLEAATRDRVDISFENVGGPVMDAVLGRLDHYARIVLCGIVSQYNNIEPYGLKNVRELLVNRASLQAFIISEHPEYWPSAISELAVWLKEGKIRYKEDVTDGLENAPKAFLAMLDGKNFGKQLIRIGHLQT